MDQRFADFEKRMDSRFDELISMMGQYAHSVDERFNAMDRRFDLIDMRFDGVDKRIAELETRVVKLESSHERVLVALDSFIARIDEYETESVVRDRQFGRLTDWAHKVAVKTATPLKDL